MKKPLSEMTLEELWELFPIFLTEHDDRWTSFYDEMEHFLAELLSGYQVTRISHIGSTAVNGIWAKSIVDILLEIDAEEDMGSVARILENNGFICMSSSDKRVSFNWGYTENGFAEKVYHLHLRYAGDNNELYFRDYLNEHSQIAKEYEQLKLNLWKKFEHDRDAYTNAKSEFVEKWTSKARKVYSNRYG